MKNAAQAWFSGGSVYEEEVGQSSSSSILADWNSYAASRESEDSSGLGFDIEAAVKTANDKVTGGFSLEISHVLRAAPRGWSVFVFIAFTMFLPVMVLMPQKFAICFTIGCAFIIGSFFALKGPKNQLLHMTTRERLPFTLGFFGSMVGTIYVSMVLHSYILSVLFSVLQVLALSYYALSYFPGGSAGLKFLTSTLTSSILRCFGR
ncbi:hypothetical protein MKW92_033756 [Papaver armeniacum]|nr:hypothetical protein MKW92_033756 [Papaver armeniacum]